jgi:hypothetical protein
MTIQVKQDSNYRGNSWWNWSVWLDGTDEELGQIEYVEYTLHPTFPQPVHRIANLETGFQLKTSGWGSFMISLEIKYKDGGSKKLTHWLMLNYPNKKEPMEAKQVVVYITTGIADISFARALRKELRNHGVKAVMLDDQLAGLPFEESLNSLLEGVTHAVIIISKNASPWTANEIEVINAVKKYKTLQLIPVIIGTDTNLPDELRNYKGIYVEDLPYDQSVAKDVCIQITKAI